MVLEPLDDRDAGEARPGDKKGLFGLGNLGGLGGIGAQKKPVQAGPDISGLVEDVNAINRRLRVLEERHSNFQRRIQVIEQNMLSSNKKVSSEVGVVNSEISDIKRTLSEIESRLIMVIKELRMTAKKEEIDVISKYLEYWEPIKFVTSEQVEKIIDEKLGERLDDSPK
jgi:hypothetical protein